MTTQRIPVSETDWTNLGTGPMAIGMDRGAVHFDTGAKPTDARSGYFHTAQGQMRLINFATSDTIWARATDTASSVVIVKGIVARQADTPTIEIFARYVDLPDPSSRQVGFVAGVVADPNSELNGLHVVAGDALGNNGRYWTAAA